MADTANDFVQSLKRGAHYSRCLYFLGSTEKRGFGINEISSIHIYELDILTSKCFQIARMPNACVDALTRRKDFWCERHSWAAIGHGDTIVFLAPFGNPVVYHIDRDTSIYGKWGLLPSLGDNWTEEMCLSSFSFSLVATVAVIYSTLFSSLALFEC